MCVRWGDTCATSFCVINGFKQGGIISPILFHLYMDDMSLMLNCSGIEGYIETSFINHLQWWQKESGPSAILSKKEQTRVKRSNKSRKTVNLYLKYNMYK